MRNRIVTIVLLLVASLLGIPPAASATPYPLNVGSLVSDFTGTHNTQEAATMKLAMVELNWRTAAPQPGIYNLDYLRSVAAKVDAARAAGRQVVLGFGIHYTPAWVLALSSYVNQTGTRNTSKANVVFSEQVRAAIRDYYRQVDSIIPLENIWAVRLNATGNQGEVGYPDDNYWAYSSGAQSGADRPASLLPNPLPGWKTGTGGPTRAQIENWARWYQGAQANWIDDQHNVVDYLGFHGWVQVISPGSGLRPSAWTAQIDQRLSSPSLLGRGVAWDKLYGSIGNKRNVVAYTSSMAQSTNYNVCSSDDKYMPLADPRANSWSAARWISRIAGQYGFKKAGEIPGYNDGSAAYYGDPGPDGLMSRFLATARACNFNAALWAHDSNLWANNGTMFKRLATAVNTINGGNNPVPAFPS